MAKKKLIRCIIKSNNYASHFRVFRFTDAGREVIVSMPESGHVAHAYGRDLDVVPEHLYFDPSVFHGMRRPPEGFYGSGLVGRVLLTPENVR